MRLLAPTSERLDAVMEWAPIRGQPDSCLMAGDEDAPYAVAYLVPDGAILSLLGPVTRLEGQAGQKAIDYLVEVAKGIATTRNKPMVWLGQRGGTWMQLEAAGFQGALVYYPGAGRKPPRRRARKKDNDDRRREEATE